MRKFKLREQLRGASPIGLGGLLWRFLVFLVALTALCLLLSALVEGCERQEDKEKYGEDIVSPDDKYTPEEEPVTARDTSAWNADYPAPVPNLPAPEDNVIAPPDEDDIVEDPRDGRRYVANVVNIILEKKDENTMAAFARRFKEEYPGEEYQIVRYNRLTYLLQVALPASEHDRFIQEAPQKLSDFSFIIFDEEIFEATARPSDPQFSNENCSWYFGAVQAYDAWDITTGSADVTIAVVDGFFDVSHPEFRGKVTNPYNVVRRNNDVSPPRGEMGQISHGSHVASLAAGNAGNGSGVCGIAPGCKLMPVSVFFDSPQPNNCIITSSMAQAEGILYAIYKGADVINLSIGINPPDAIRNLSPADQMELIRRSPKYAEAVWEYIFRIAAERNCVIVWAAGNENVVAGLDSSKRNKHTIRVSGVDRTLHKWTEGSAGGSNIGYEADGENGARDFSSVSAPGKDIFSAAQGGQYMVMSGTSMAAPIVTGAVALMKSIDRSLTADAVIKILQKTGKPVGDGCGPLIQIADALKMLKGEMLNYDEVVKRPEAIVGLWESTTPLESTLTREPIKMYFRFTSTTSGQIIVRVQSSGEEYTAPLNVKIGNGHINIVQPVQAKSSAGTMWARYSFGCKPDKNRNLQVDAQNIDQASNVFSCNMRRVE